MGCLGWVIWPQVCTLATTRKTLALHSPRSLEHIIGFVLFYRRAGVCHRFARLVCRVSVDATATTVLSPTQLASRRTVGKMSAFPLSQDNTLPSAHQTGSTRDTSAVSHGSTLLSSRHRDADDDYSPAAGDSHSNPGQMSFEASSPQSQSFYGKVACQTCVSVKSLFREDVWDTLLIYVLFSV